jgi:hypothetical protein
MPPEGHAVRRPRNSCGNGARIEQWHKRPRASPCHREAYTAAAHNGRLPAKSGIVRPRAPNRDLVVGHALWIKHLTAEVEKAERAEAKAMEAEFKAMEAEAKADAKAEAKAKAKQPRKSVLTRNSREVKQFIKSFVEGIAGVAQGDFVEAKAVVAHVLQGRAPPSCEEGPL